MGGEFDIPVEVEKERKNACFIMYIYIFLNSLLFVYILASVWSACVEALQVRKEVMSRCVSGATGVLQVCKVILSRLIDYDRCVYV